MADFTRTDVAHLLRRAAFGGTAAEIDDLAGEATWAAVVDRVLDTTANPPDPIPPAVDDRTDEWWAPFVAGVHHWMNRMATSPTPVVEKATLFWHSNLASSIDDVLPRLVFRQIRTYRARALGDVHALLQAMAKDPAMLIYLSNADNVAAEPNENFARELMELFTLGNGAFAESDVVAMARAWTGHNLDASGEAYAFRPDDHDTGLKTLFGITRNWDGPATITEIVRGSQQRTCARFLAAKWWSFLAYPAPSAALVDDLASAFIAGGMRTDALLRAILLRPEFRLASTRTALVRSPVEWLVAVMRALDLTAEELHPEWWVDRLGQVLYRPPNVSGWKQNAAWISTSTQWGKGQLASYLRWSATEAGVFGDVGTKTPAAAAQAMFDRFGVDAPSSATRQRVVEFVTRERAAGRSWAVAPGLVALGMLAPDVQIA